MFVSQCAISGRVSASGVSLSFDTLTLKQKSFPVNSFGYNTVTWVSLFNEKLKLHIESPPISHKECKKLHNTFLMWIWRRVFKSAKQKQEKMQTCNEVIE